MKIKSAIFTIYKHIILYNFLDTLTTTDIGSITFPYIYIFQVFNMSILIVLKKEMKFIANVFIPRPFRCSL